MLQGDGSFFCGECICACVFFFYGECIWGCLLSVTGETVGQRELVYHQRFFNLSILVLKARQLSPLFLLFLVSIVSYFDLFRLVLLDLPITRFYSVTL